MADVKIEHHGSIVLVRPLTDTAKEWMNENVNLDDSYQPYWPTVVVEPRFLEPFIDGMEAHGLVLT